MAKVGSGLGVLVAIAIGVGACGGGGTKARTALPAAGPAVAAVAATGGTAPSALESPAAPAPTPATAGAALPAPSAAAKKSVSAPQAAAAAPAAAAAAAAPMAAAAVSTGVPRRVPTAAEVNQVISQVHSALKFFTPTPADIATTGDQVCTAFDQGKTFSQVTSKALDIVGAGTYKWMIPSSAPASAVRGLVALYCPGYSYKLV